VQIARELIEQNDQRQRAAGSVGPLIECALARGMQCGGEGAAGGVEVVLPAEPDLTPDAWVTGEPEVQHFIRRDHAKARSKTRTE